MISSSVQVVPRSHASAPPAKPIEAPGWNPGLNAPKLKAGSEWKCRGGSWRYIVEIERIAGAQVFFRSQWNGKRSELPADLFLQNYRPLE